MLCWLEQRMPDAAAGEFDWEALDADVDDSGSASLQAGSISSDWDAPSRELFSAVLQKLRVEREHGGSAVSAPCPGPPFALGGDDLDLLSAGLSMPTIWSASHPGSHIRACPGQEFPPMLLPAFDCGLVPCCAAGRLMRRPADCGARLGRSFPLGRRGGSGARRPRAAPRPLDHPARCDAPPRLRSASHQQPLVGSIVFAHSCPQLPNFVCAEI